MYEQGYITSSYKIYENIISKYQFNVKSFDRIEDFGIEKRSLYAHSTFGKFLLKVKVSVSLVLLPKSGKFFKKNIFEGCRYPDIIDLFNPEDCSIIEGWHAFPTVIKKRQGFIWGGGIIAAFEIAMHLGDYTFLNRIIDRLNLWNIDQKEMFLYLYEDTQPLGIVLSSVFFNSKNIHTICIAHGYFPDTDSKLKYEGNNSNYNFVWSLSQAKFFNKDVNVTLLGLPYEYSMAKILNKNRIILLGHSGEGTNMFEYLLTYFHMFFVYNLLLLNI